MTAQTTAERNRLDITRRMATSRLDIVVDLLTKLRDPLDDTFLVSAEVRSDPNLQMVLGEIRQEAYEALLYLRRQRECIRCGEVLPEDEVVGGYCSKH